MSVHPASSPARRLCRVDDRMPGDTVTIKSHPVFSTLNLIPLDICDSTVNRTPAAAARNPAATGSGGPAYSDPATANGGHGYWKNVHAYFSLCLSDARRPIGLYWKNASPYEIRRRDEAIAQAIGWGSR